MAFEPKTALITVRVTPTQADLLRAGADREGDRLSTWIRRLALRQAVELTGGSPDEQRVSGR